MTPKERAEKILLLCQLPVSDAAYKDGRNGLPRSLKDEIAAAVAEAYEDANKDFAWLRSAVAKIYCHFTDNKMSKWNYDPSVVISEIEETQDQFWESEIAKARAEAFEEAAKICENPQGLVSRDYIRYAQSTVAPEIRARAKEVSK